MAVELEFLAYLHMRVGAAMNAEDKSEIATWNAALAKFEPHIRCWGADFFATCERCAHDVTYRWLGKVGKTFLESIFAETD